MGSQFSMSSKAKNRQPTKGEPAELEDLLVDLDAELRQFQAGFCYATASVQQRETVLAIAHKLLAEQLTVGGQATVKLDSLITATRGHIIKAWLGDMAEKLVALEAAEAFLSDCPAADRIRASQAEAGEQLAEAEEAVALAERRRDEIKAEVKRLEMLAARRSDAERTTSTKCASTLAAMDHLRRLRAARADA